MGMTKNSCSEMMRDKLTFRRKHRWRLLKCVALLNENDLAHTVACDVGIQHSEISEYPAHNPHLTPVEFPAHWPSEYASRGRRFARGVYGAMEHTHGPETGPSWVGEHGDEIQSLKRSFKYSVSNRNECRKMFLGSKAWPVRRTDEGLWAHCPDNVGSSISHNPICLHGLLPYFCLLQTSHSLHVTGSYSQRLHVSSSCLISIERLIRLHSARTLGIGWGNSMRTATGYIIKESGFETGREFHLLHSILGGCKNRILTV
jgi:hypothetical protein